MARNCSTKVQFAVARLPPAALSLARVDFDSKTGRFARQVSLNAMLAARYCWPSSSLVGRTAADGVAAAGVAAVAGVAACFDRGERPQPAVNNMLRPTVART